MTLCVKDRECLFGEIRDGKMHCNDAGLIVQTVWDCLLNRFSNLALDAFVVMPNHIHGILGITDPEDTPFVGAPLAAPAHQSEANRGEMVTPLGAGAGAASGAPTKAITIGQIVRAFKSISAVHVNRLLERSGMPLWQRNYYERILRDETELFQIREYIAQNPLRWMEDQENPQRLATQSGGPFDGE